MFSSTQKYIKVTEKIPEQAASPKSKALSTANPLTSTEKLRSSPRSLDIIPQDVSIKEGPSQKTPLMFNLLDMTSLSRHIPSQDEEEFEVEKLYMVNFVEDDKKEWGPATRSLGLDADDDRRAELLEILESFAPFPALNAIYAESLESIAGGKLTFSVNTNLSPY